MPLAIALLSSETKEADIAGLTGSQYVARLAAEATTVVNAPDFARVIAEHSDRRKIIKAAETMTAAANIETSPATLAVDCIGALDEIASRYIDRHTAPVSFARAAERSIGRMQEAMTNGGKITGITTGLRDLDAKLNGLQRGDYIILAGRPGMGKSGLAISSMRQVAEQRANVLLFSLEMPADRVADRMLSDALYNVRSPITYFNIVRGNVSNEQAEAIIDAQRAMRGLSIKIDPQSALTASQIAARARRHKQLLEHKGRTLDLVIVDHLHIMRASSRYAGNRVAEITEISAGLKALAKELNVPVMALAQLSRQVEHRDDKRPTMADLRDSGSIEQDADAILFLYREAYYLEAPLDDPVKDQARIARLAEVKNLLELKVAKQRNGPTGTVKLFFDPASNAARNISLLEMERAAA